MQFSQVFYFPQKLKDVAFPQAEILKKALLKRFDQEYAQYLAKKVNTQKYIHYINLQYNKLKTPVCYSKYNMNIHLCISTLKLIVNRKFEVNRKISCCMDECWNKVPRLFIIKPN